MLRHCLCRDSKLHQQVEDSPAARDDVENSSAAANGGTFAAAQTGGSHSQQSQQVQLPKLVRWLVLLLHT